MTTSQIRERITDIELPLLVNNLYEDIRGDLNKPSAYSRAMANNIFVREWLQNGEQDETVLASFIKENKEKGNLSFANIISEQSGRIYEADGFYRELDKSNPLDNWYWEFTNGTEDHLLVLSPSDQHDGALMVYLDDKIKSKSGELLGVVGVMLDMSRFSEKLSSNQIGEHGRNLLLNSKGEKVIIPEDTSGFARSIRKEAGLKTIASQILSEKDGRYVYEKGGDEYWVSVKYFPEYDWYVLVEASQQELLTPINKYFRNLFLIGAVVIIIVLVIGNFAIGKLLSPIEHVSQVAQRIVKGDLDAKVDVKTKMAELATLKQALNALVTALTKTTTFAREISKGNLDVDYSAEEGQNTDLGVALIEMRDELRNVEEQGKQRAWSTQGVAHFNDLLRNNDKELSELADELISELVQYANANQGAMFVVNEEDEDERMLEMVACYAYKRKKYLNQKLMIGEGLAGQAYLEKDIIYLTEVPEDYVNITSGLGKATPKAVLIVPMMLNDEVLGVIELASFHQFEKHEIEFIRKIAEAIASTLTMVRNNTKMRTILEDFQEQAEMMKSQEEEMRQNMEELQATQEEVIRKEKDYQQRIEELEAQVERLSNQE